MIDDYDRGKVNDIWYWVPKWPEPSEEQWGNMWQCATGVTQSVVLILPQHPRKITVVACSNPRAQQYQLYPPTSSRPVCLYPYITYSTQQIKKH